MKRIHDVSDWMKWLKMDMGKIEKCTTFWNGNTAKKFISFETHFFVQNPNIPIFMAKSIFFRYIFFSSLLSFHFDVSLSSKQNILQKVWKRRWRVSVPNAEGKWKEPLFFLECIRSIFIQLCSFSWREKSYFLFIFCAVSKVVISMNNFLVSTS